MDAYHTFSGITMTSLYSTITTSIFIKLPNRYNLIKKLRDFPNKDDSNADRQHYLYNRSVYKLRTICLIARSWNICFKIFLKIH